MARCLALSATSASVWLWVVVMGGSSCRRVGVRDARRSRGSATSVHPPISGRDRAPYDWVHSPGGEQATDGSGPGGLPVQAELVVGVLEVPLDGANAQGQLGRDLRVVVPVRGQPEDLQLASGQQVARVTPAEG